jgi:hypothetical protein
LSSRALDRRSPRLPTETDDRVWRLMTIDRLVTGDCNERETGIEPATNSLEGCDSTTELLPHFIADWGLRTADFDWRFCFEIRNPQSAFRNLSIPRMVAREGLEPSKPLGRQIYSLLRLTASLPRRCPCVIVQRSPSVRPPRTGRHGCSVRPQPNATSESSNCIC